MIIIKEVKTTKEAKLFTSFPNKLYKNVEAFVPALSIDEMNVFNKKKNPVHEYAESIRFLAYKNNAIVGRIAGIINHKWNRDNNKRYARFTRIDMIDDINVTKALIDTIENWAKDQQMDTLIGPIGFTDLDRQGMLVDGFDQLNMFITIYNHPYYHEHLETLGFTKDVDWLEKKVSWPEDLEHHLYKKISKGSEYVKKKFGYHLFKPKRRKDIFKYIYEAFDMYNKAFSELYGFYPITEKVMDYYIKQMILIVRKEYVWFVLDKEDNVVGFGIIMPSLAIANKKNNGKLFPFGWLRILKALRKYSVMDFYFIAVAPEHQGRGVISLIFEDGLKNTIKNGVHFAETGPELELNHAIHAQWKDFDFVEHKRRRCYIRAIDNVSIK